MLPSRGLTSRGIFGKVKDAVVMQFEIVVGYAEGID
jgi:hypothetical protein